MGLNFGGSGSGGGGSGPTNPKRYITLPAGWNTQWTTAKAAGTATILIIGDSIAQGTQQNSNIITKRWPRLLRDYFSAQNGFGSAWRAEFFDSADAPGSIGTWSAGGSNPWTNGGAAGLSPQVDSFGKYEIFATGTSGTIMTFTCPFNVTRVDFIYRDLAAGTLQWTVGGVSQPAITTNGNGAVKKATWTGASASPAIAIGAQSVSTEVGILGFTLYGPGDPTGITIASHGCNGLASSNLNANASAIQAYGALQAAVGPIGTPDLCIYELAVNDAGLANSLAATANGINWLTRAVKKAQPACSFLFVLPCDPGSASDAGANFSNPDTYDGYVGTIFGIAQGIGAGFINIDEKWSQTPVGQGFIASGSGSGQPHPNDAGHADIASVIESVL